MANTKRLFSDTNEFLVEVANVDKSELSENKDGLEEFYKQVFQKCELDRDGKICAKELHLVVNYDADNTQLPKTAVVKIHQVMDEHVSKQEESTAFMEKALVLSNSFKNHAKGYTDYFVITRELEPEEKDAIKTYNLLPSFILLISLVQILFMIIDEHLTYYLRYESLNKTEVWRFWTYFLVSDVYDGCSLLTDIILQFLVGFPMEKVFEWWRVMIVYMSGVIAGSLLQSVHNADYLTGGRGGVYALLTSYALSIIKNRKQMKRPFFQLIAIGLFMVFDCMSYTVKLNYISQFLQRGILANIGGIAAGILVGIHVLRNNVANNTDSFIRWTCFTLFFLLAGVAVVVDLVVLR